MMKKVLATIGFTLVPSVALAHTGVGTTHGFTAGLLHPLSGLDHLLAMVGVGLLAAMIGGRATYLVPTSFLAMMVVGGALGSLGVALPGVEVGIALSVIVIGGLVAMGANVPTLVASLLAAVFALFHGHAHGTELPLGGDIAGYTIGFVLATAFLHAVGLGMGFGLDRLGDPSGRRFMRFSGGVGAVLGVVILAGLV